ncbi:glycoside hydrolase family 13 protein [Kineococcus sp. TRM81007]|uniref:glycoside hydrolase family 13 protein n=1 Tax=Kineococcus sp. TRM81007 TaxID=2925831 RepID=UPI001F5AF9E8|nr:alpha-amylase family glycosyl hydrolase [Kineococcus sp. TRM81007]MCI2240009.1 glycoside hydrolase family 13 protein [Kineococcus sp. TRM81007]
MGTVSDTDTTPAAPWWRDAVIYQVYPRSFADGDGDGLGDLPGITSRLPHLADLGVDAVWLSPVYPSPQKDAGYDVADYRGIEPVFGTLADFEALSARAHELGLRVVMDLVPNHTSADHAWFREALASPPGSPARARYVFRDGRGASGELPPNSWRSVFGGSAWTRATEPDGAPGQWYLHLFDSSQPDLDWSNPEVHTEFEDVLRFWLDRGVDGFRVDVAHGLIKAEGLPEWDHDQELLNGSAASGERPPMWDQEGVHEIYREWRRVLDSYDGERILVAEAWVTPPERLARYVRGDEMHQAFNFDYLRAPWRSGELKRVIDATLQAHEVVGAPATWVLSNHDVVRHASRLGYPAGGEPTSGVGPDDPQPDAELGLRRARAATLFMLALPGGAYVYQGEELGLPEVTTLPAEVRQDPAFARTGGEDRGRDGCRVPIPWEGDAPSYGFGPGTASWLPQPPEWAELSVAAQTGVAGSTLELYRSALAVRRERALGRGELEWEAELTGGDVLAFRTRGVLVVLNLSAEPVAVPPGAHPLLVSGELADGSVPTDTAAWFALG